MAANPGQSLPALTGSWCSSDSVPHNAQKKAALKSHTPSISKHQEISHVQILLGVPLGTPLQTNSGKMAFTCLVPYSTVTNTFQTPLAPASIYQPNFFEKFIFNFYFMCLCVRVLQVHQVHAWYPRRPEEGVRVPGTRVTDSFVLRTEPGSSARAAGVFNC